MVRVQNYKAMLGESGQPYEVGKRLDCSVRCRLSFPRLSGFVNRDAAPVLIFIGTTRAIVGARVHLRPMPVVFPVVRKSIVTFLLVLFTSMGRSGGGRVFTGSYQGGRQFANQKNPAVGCVVAPYKRFVFAGSVRSNCW